MALSYLWNIVPISNAALKIAFILHTLNIYLLAVMFWSLPAQHHSFNTRTDIIDRIHISDVKPWPTSGLIMHPCWAHHTHVRLIVGDTDTHVFEVQLLLLSCAKSHMLSPSRQQPHLLRVSAVDRRQTWSMDKSWRSVTLSGFLQSTVT